MAGLTLLGAGAAALVNLDRHRLQALQADVATVEALTDVPARY